jgi:hypothetical protein
MDNSPQPGLLFKNAPIAAPTTTTNMGEDWFSSKDTLIIVLVVLLVLSFLGINVLTTGGNILQIFADIFGPLFNQILSLFGYTAGTIINTGADVVGDTAIAGIEIAKGSIENVGDLLIDASKTNIDPSARSSLDNIISSGNRIRTPNVFSPDTSESPIQKPLSSGSSKWCLVGEYKSKRGCIEIDEHDKCMSGQIYPSQKMCINPTLTSNM